MGFKKQWVSCCCLIYPMKLIPTKSNRFKIALVLLIIASVLMMKIGKIIPNAAVINHAKEPKKSIIPINRSTDNPTVSNANIQGVDLSQKD